MMNFSWVSAGVYSACSQPIYDVAFVGDVVDERGEHCLSVANITSSLVLDVKYVPAEYKICIAGTEWRANEVERIAQTFPAKNILFDATTLDFPDLLLIIKGYLKGGEKDVKFHFLYAEPLTYNSAAKMEGRHEFKLSDSYAVDYFPIPGFIHLQTNPNNVGSVTVFVGFEGARLQNLIADSEPEISKRINVVFGIPPFNTEWETHSLMQNATVLQNEQIDEVLYAGANNPYSCYEIISMLYQARAGNTSFEIAPLGTKPAAIAAALFAAETSGVSVRYDYPKRSKGRSSGVGKVHVFTAWRES
ncbi:hypothetical protein [Pseudomonas nunensis]|uniref:hypothetical protein n=1 Tax=Pseudomonas nunensis TaxID=2961896 RepID=UPI0006B5DE8E|nr:hypothetical protein [Pseudomonas nunensis]KOY01761.1 hypothetical protein AM274_14360 [Pseudomonas nunensis]